MTRMMRKKMKVTSRMEDDLFVVETKANFILLEHEEISQPPAKLAKLDKQAKVNGVANGKATKAEQKKDQNQQQKKQKQPQQQPPQKVNHRQSH